MANIENNILKLLPHQEEAYDKCISLFEKEKNEDETARQRAAVVFPTGCGKSFVILKYILEHPDERILFLSPRNAIKDQMYEYVIRFIGGDNRPIEEIIAENGNLKKAAQKYIPNLRCDLYQSMLGYGKKDNTTDSIDKLKPDIIIVDEMHHLKTKSMRDENNILIDDDDVEQEKEDLDSQNEWGRKFQAYLDANPQAKLLGVTATPIRTDNANVVERLFEGAIAKNMSLLQAIESEIIYPPKYVVPDFIRQDELETWLQKIEKETDENTKKKLKTEYDDFVKKSTEMPGIPDVLKENINEHNPQGKYIIFCKDINDMKEKMMQSKEWFGEIDEEPEIYGISSKDNTSDKQLADFNASTSDHLKLMYCVGMIDEGVHLNDVSGVILAAKTGSRPTYFQRIGRAISSGKDKKQAIVIDLVNNNEILNEKGKRQNGYEMTDFEALEKLVQWIEQENNGNLPEFSEKASSEEKLMAKRFARLNNKYLKYEKNKELLSKLDEDKYEEVTEIIGLGKTIEMFQEKVNLEIDDEEYTGKEIEAFLRAIEIKGVRKEFKNILRGMKNSKSKSSEIISVCESLHEQGVDLQTINTVKKVEENGKVVRKSTTLADIKEKYPNIHLESILLNLDIESDYPIGAKLVHLRTDVKNKSASKKIITDEERQKALDLNIIDRKSVRNKSGNNLGKRVTKNISNKEIKNGANAVEIYEEQKYKGRRNI